MRKLSGVFVWLVLAYSATNANGHEVWLSPKDYTLAANDVMTVSLLQGSGMKGSALIYLPNDITRFDVITGDSTVPVTGRMGDEPVLNMPAGVDGLAIIVHETKDSVANYRDFSVFERFVADKSFKTALADHAARGLPQIGFSETYRRYAKSLVAVGKGVGADRAVGLKIEIIALANPYTDDVSAGMPLQVLLDGKPRADTQIELFQTAPDGTVTISRHRTNSVGQAVVPVLPNMEYLADNVLLTPLSNNDPSAGPVWHSDWASLTFHTVE